MHLFQSPEWEEFKLATGWQKSHRVDGILILQKKLPLGMTMLYSPMVDSCQLSAVSLKDLVKKIRPIAKESNAVFYRLEIDDSIDKAKNYKLATSNFVKAAKGIQPDQTRIIDLTKTPEEILAQMKQKGRYNIKVAQKHEVNVGETNDINRFYTLYKNMSQRHVLGLRSKDYFQKLIDILGPKGYVKVFIASLKIKDAPNESTNLAKIRNYESKNNETMKQSSNEIDLAAAIISYFGKSATYLFGGSSDEMKNAMAPYLLHWEIMKGAKSAGFERYDLFGVSPEGAKDHKWSGVTTFKEKFGGEYVELMGSWDFAFKPVQYKILNIAERIRRK
jgi:lipid II:glycine glycyltransferase (peptidoglycan interpeptide bridge formation enzyme)